MSQRRRRALQRGPPPNLRFFFYVLDICGSVSPCFGGCAAQPPFGFSWLWAPNLRLDLVSLFFRLYVTKLCSHSDLSWSTERASRRITRSDSLTLSWRKVLLCFFLQVDRHEDFTGSVDELCLFLFWKWMKTGLNRSPPFLRDPLPVHFLSLHQLNPDLEMLQIILWLQVVTSPPLILHFQRSGPLLTKQ